MRCPDCREVESQVCNLHGMGDMDETDKRMAALEAEIARLKAQAKADMDAEDGRFRALFWPIFHRLKELGAPRFRGGADAEELIAGIEWVVERLTRERDEAAAKEREECLAIARKIAEENVDGERVGAAIVRAIAARQ